MVDFTAYRDKVSNYGKLAHAAEKEEKYDQAYEYYTKALDIFMHMIKCKYHKITSSTFLTYLNESLPFLIDEKNPKLIDIYKQKMGEYLERAEYLKKTVLNKSKEEPVIN